MDSFLNQNKKKEYSLEDAFHIIQSIINTEKDKYEKIIKTTIKTIKGRKYKI